MESFLTSPSEFKVWLDAIWSLYTLKALAVGFVIAFLINLTGVGGGVLIIPSLVLLFDLPPSVAIGTASIYSTITKVMSCADHISRKNVNFSLSKKILTIALPATLVSSLLVNLLLAYTPQHNMLIQDVLSFFVLGIMVLACYLIYSQNRMLQHQVEHKEPSGFIRVIICAMVGLIMGATGIGGGILLIPTLLFISNDNIKQVVGTSIFIALVLSAATALIYSSGDQSHLGLLAILLVGSFIAIPLSGKLNHSISPQSISYLTITLIVISGVMIVFS